MFYSRRSRGSGLRVALLVLFALGCGRSADSSAGVAGPAEWTLAPEPTLSVGVLAGEPEYELFRVRAAFRLSDGGLVIVNGGSHELRFYDRSGRHLRSAGRQGQGPGEFQQIFSAQRIRGDSVAVWDNLQRRISLFAPTGQRGRDLGPDLTGESVTVNSVTTPAMPSEVAFRDDGSFVVIPIFPRWALTGLRINDEGYGVVRDDSVATDGVWQAEHPVYVFDASGQLLSKSPVLGSTEYVVHEGTVQFRMFGQRLGIAGGGERFLVWTGQPGRVLSLSSNGDTARVEMALPARALTPEVVEAEISRSAQFFAESSRDQMRRLFESVPPPDSLPRFSRLLLDDQERIWAAEYRTALERESATSIRWRVFSPSGVPVATLTVPADLRVSDVSFGYVTGYVRDEFDVERVDSYWVDESGGDF